MKPIDGGPAFPSHVEFPKQPGNGVAYNEGLSMRDYFAAKAMQSLTMRQGPGGFDFLTFPDDPVRFGKWAYDIADAMLKAREA